MDFVIHNVINDIYDVFIGNCEKIVGFTGEHYGMVMQGLEGVKEGN